MVQYRLAAWVHCNAGNQLLWCVDESKLFHTRWTSVTSLCLHRVHPPHVIGHAEPQTMKSVLHFHSTCFSMHESRLAWLSDLWPLQVPQLLPVRRSSATRFAPLARWPGCFLCSGMQTGPRVPFSLPSPRWPTPCRPKGDVATEIYQATVRFTFSSTDCFSVFQLVVLVFPALTFLNWFSLDALRLRWTPPHQTTDGLS